jgi:cytochrome c-type biogenesis protein CcmF
VGQGSVIGATLDVLGKDSAVIGTIEPRMNFYRVSDQPVPTPDVRSTLKGDLYVNLMAFESNGSNATIKVIVEPLVPWIWFGGLVMVIGSIIGMFHSGKRAAATAMASRVRPPAGTMSAVPEPETAEVVS